MGDENAHVSLIVLTVVSDSNVLIGDGVNSKSSVSDSNVLDDVIDENVRAGVNDWISVSTNNSAATTISSIALVAVTESIDENISRRTSIVAAPTSVPAAT